MYFYLGRKGTCGLRDPRGQILPLRREAHQAAGSESYRILVLYNVFFNFLLVFNDVLADKTPVSVFYLPSLFSPFPPPPNIFIFPPFSSLFPILSAFPLFLLFSFFSIAFNFFPPAPLYFSLFFTLFLTIKVEYRKITVFVSMSPQTIYMSGLDPQGENMDIPVRVLDCDTITQVAR